MTHRKLHIFYTFYIRFLYRSIIVAMFILPVSVYAQNTDSLISIFKKSEGHTKRKASYELANHWYNQRNDSALFFIDYILNNNHRNSDTIYAFAHKLKGNIEVFENNLERAEMHYKNALKIYKKANNDGGVEACFNNLGIVLLKQHKFDEAINYLNQSIDFAEKNRDLLSKAKSLHNLAYIYELKEKNATALGYYLKALHIKRKFNDSASVSSTLNNIGNIYDSYRDFDKAIKYYKQSLAINRYLKDSNEIALRYYNLGRVYSKKNMFESSMENYLASLEIFESIKNDPKIAKVYNALANLYYKWDKNKSAIEYYKKALQKLDPTKNEIEKARIFVNLAGIYRTQKKLSAAEKKYKQALEIFSTVDFFKEKLYSYLNYAKLLVEQKKYTEAKKYFAKGIALARDKKQIYHLAVALVDYSTLYQKKRDYRTANKVLKTALSKAKEANSLQLLQSVYSHFYLNYKKLNKYKTALYFYEKTKEIEDSLYNEQTLKNITELEKKYQLNQKEKEILLLSSQNKLQKIENTAQKIRIEKITLIKNFAIGGGIFLILVIIFVIYALVMKRKANQKLTYYNAEIIEQKEEIETQRDEIEAQLKQIESQRELLQNQQNDITDSINYARYIQRSIFPKDDFFNKHFSDYFIYYQPKNIVSGDFYFGEETKNSIYMAVVDCTGHGVPGAFMSLLAYNALRTSVIEKQIIKPSKILEDIDLQIKVATHKSSEIAGNGMDMILLKLDKKSGLLTAAGAKRSLIVFRKGELHEIPTTKRSIGRIHLPKKYPYEDHTWQLAPNDILYMFTDGFADQFGGENRKKFKSTQLKNKLYEIQNMQLSIQKNILNRTFVEWKGKNEQIDDILVLGIKI